MRKIIDTESLKAELAAGGRWATTVGKGVAKRRSELGLSVRDVAAMSNVPVQTIYRIEAGELIARDYLRLAVAHVLCTDAASLFALPDREAVAAYMDVAA